MIGRFYRFAYILLAFAALFTVCTIISCSKSNSTAVSQMISAPAPGPSESDTDFVIIIFEQDISQVLDEVDEFPAPEGVSSNTFALLKAELVKAFEARRSAGSIEKFTSGAPSGSAGRVSDLEYNYVTGILSWTYVNDADYDLNGEVGVPDITPIAENYLLSVGTDPLLRWIDQSGDGEVGIPDITPIAANYLNLVAEYAIVTCDEIDGEYTEIGRVAFSQNSGEIPPEFFVDLPEGAMRYVRVQPVDLSEDAGDLSNPVTPLAPRILGVEPIVGNEGAEVQFSTDVVGAEPITYAWDFADAAEPSTSNEPSPTVTMLEGGTYEVSLTVENEYGVATLDFNLEVIAKTYMVSGNITFEDSPLPDVNLTLDEAYSADTDADGNFLFEDVASGTYTLTPTHPEYVFEPASREVTVLKSDVADQDFIAVWGFFTVTGTIVNDEGGGLDNIRVIATDGTDSYEGLTDAVGDFTIEDIPNGAWTITPTDTYCIFTPNTLDVEGYADTIADQDFLAEFTHELGAYDFRTGPYDDMVVRFAKKSNIQIYFWDGSGVDGFDPAFAEAAQNGMLQWNAVGDRWQLFHVSITDDYAEAEIEVEWVKSLGGSVAGKAHWSGSEGELELPLLIELATHVNNNLTNPTSIFAVATHECGHTLGIWGHSDLEEDVMFPISYVGSPSKRDEFTVYTVYHLPADYSTDLRGPSSIGGERIVWSME